MKSEGILSEKNERNSPLTDENRQQGAGTVPMKTAMITADENGIPAETLKAIRDAGIDIICKKCENPEELVAFAKDADVLWMFGPNIALTGDALRRLPACKAVFRSGSGIDALPLAEAKELGIAVCNTPDSISESVAEHAVSLLFALIRHIPQFDRDVRRGVWNSGGSETHWHISGRTLGLVGYGRIARNVERMVSGFNLKVVHYDPYAPGSIPLDELLKTSDYISVHCPLTDETRHCISTEQFNMMKPNALLVNTSRGPVIDEKALIEALKSRRIGGAALDVTDPEPPEAGSELMQLTDNLILTPHVAAFSADFEKNFWAFSVEKLKALSSGDYMKYNVLR